MTPDIMLVLAVLVITVGLFVTEALRVDVIAMLVMLTLPWLGLVKPDQAFSGFASQAVISIIAVMILGYGVDRTGIMQQVSRSILRVAGQSERRLLGVTLSAVGGLSAFMQNVGAAALFLPALMRMGQRTGIPPSRLLMPMGFAAILGGTLRMVGSSPLILLNGLLRQRGQETFGLFGVTPVGLVLLGAGISYFVLFGKYVLPTQHAEDATAVRQRELIASWQLPTAIWELEVPRGSQLIGTTRQEVQLETQYRLHLVALSEHDEVIYAPWRHTHFAAGQELVMLGDRLDVERFAADYGLRQRQTSESFEDLQQLARAGFAELIVAPRSALAGKSIRDIALRNTYHVEPLILLSGGAENRGDFSDTPFQVGDALIVHGRWEHIKAMSADRQFVLLTPVDIEDIDASKGYIAGACLVGAIGLALAGVALPLAFFSGALAMILLGVLRIEDAYKAVDWRTVFLLAGLIPLGLAMDQTGAASFVANLMMQMLTGSYPLIILMAVAILTTAFSLFMSNAAATVLLVPLVTNLAGLAQLDPRALALLVGVCASNSFILPTHQVNALLMAPGGYRNAHYLKAGGLMTALFLVLAVGSIYLMYSA